MTEHLVGEKDHLELSRLIVEHTVMRQAVGLPGGPVAGERADRALSDEVHRRGVPVQDLEGGDLTVDGGERRLMVAAIRYLDTFTKRDGAWLFAERLLYFEWQDEHAVS